MTGRTAGTQKPLTPYIHQSCLGCNKQEATPQGPMHGLMTQNDDGSCTTTVGSADAYIHFHGFVASLTAGPLAAKQFSGQTWALQDPVIAMVQPHRHFQRSPAINTSSLYLRPIPHFCQQSSCCIAYSPEETAQLPTQTSAKTWLHSLSRQTNISTVQLPHSLGWRDCTRASGANESKSLTSQYQQPKFKSQPFSCCTA